METDALLDEARRAMERAYAPYSRFRVGAALRASDGSVWSGCNVENASYGLTVCAERVAVFRAVEQGTTTFEALALVTSGSEVVPPCGACLQVLSEFCADLRVISAGREGRVEWSLRELLPERFRGSPGWLSKRDETRT